MEKFDSDIFQNLPQPVGAFITSFDIIHRKGYILDMIYPSLIKIENLEYSAIPSGSHNVDKDVILFTTKDQNSKSYYCLAAFYRLKHATNSSPTRGATIKSIGFMFEEFDTSTLLHLPHLESWAHQAAHMELIENETEQSIQKKKLMETLKDYVINPPVSMATEEELIRVQKQYIRSMHLFFNLFGEKMFLLWKYVLLQKRILFYSPPPIQNSCLFVHFLSLMKMTNFRLPSSMFNITTFDIPEIENTTSYIASTSDKLFLEKPKLWDVIVMVEDGSIKTSLETMSDKQRKMKTSIYDSQSFKKLVKRLKIKNTRAAKLNKFSNATIQQDQYQENPILNHVFSTLSNHFQQFFINKNECIQDSIRDAGDSEGRQVFTLTHFEKADISPDDSIMIAFLSRIGG